MQSLLRVTLAVQAVDARGVDGRERDGDGGDQRAADGPDDVGKDVLVQGGSCSRGLDSVDMK